MRNLRIAASAAVAVAATAWCGPALANADMSGAVNVFVTASGSGSSYTCSTERMQIQTIYNDGATIPDLRARVWYHTSDNFFTSGYVVASYAIGTLNGGATISNFDRTVNCSQTPPNGDYCVTLALEENSGGTYYVEDYVKFSGCQRWPPTGACTTGLVCNGGEYYTPGGGGYDEGYDSGGALDASLLLLLAGAGFLAPGLRRRR